MKREIDFNNGFNGTLYLDDLEIKIGRNPSDAKPYDLLFGALASCLYSTFLDVLESENESLTSTKIIVEGEKRETIPTTLEFVHITMVMSGYDHPGRIEALFKRAYDMCSMVQTVSNVASITYTLNFI